MKEKQKIEYYNSEIKKFFIQQKKEDRKKWPTPTFLEDLFTKVGEKEFILEKDLYDFTHEDVISFYKSLNTISVSSLIVINNIFSNYYFFCLREKYINNLENVFTTIHPWELAKCAVDLVFFDREEILNMCKEGNRLRNESDKVLLLGLYEGIAGRGYNDLYSLEKMDFHEYSGLYTVILKSGREAEISKELYNYAMNAIEEFEYHSYGVNQKVYSYNESVPENEFRVFKSVRPNLPNSIMFIRNHFIKIMEQWDFNKNDNSVIIQDIIKSGMIWKMKRRINELNKDFHSYVYSSYFISDMKKWGYTYQWKGDFFEEFKKYFD